MGTKGDRLHEVELGEGVRVEDALVVLQFLEVLVCGYVLEEVGQRRLARSVVRRRNHAAQPEQILKEEEIKGGT